MNNQDIALGFFILLFVIVVTYFLTRESPKEPRYEYAEQVDGEDSSKIIDSLTQKIKFMEEEDAKLRSQINLINLQAGIQNEQTKYLTANVNRTLYP